MYEDLARTVLVDEDPTSFRAVDRVRAHHPKESPEQLSRRLAQRTALRCAAVGAATCAGMELLDRFVPAADLWYQALSFARLAASIARVHRRPTTVIERGLVAAGSLLVAGASDVLRRGATGAAHRALPDRARRLAPVVSALAGAGIAYAAAKIFARAAADILPDIHRRLRPDR